MNFFLSGAELVGENDNFFFAGPRLDQVRPARAAEKGGVSLRP